MSIVQVKVADTYYYKFCVLSCKYFNTQTQLEVNPKLETYCLNLKSDKKCWDCQFGTYCVSNKLKDFGLSELCLTCFSKYFCIFLYEEAKK